MPGSLSAVSVGVEGFGVAGVGARLVAYLLDSLIWTTVPYVLAIFALDWADLIRFAVAASATGSSATYAIPISLNLVLLAAISIAISYAYFVGWWSGGHQATPGMRLLGMRVIDADTQRTLTLGAATRRWVILGAPFSFLGLVAPLQVVATIVSSLLPLVLLLTTLASDRRQGLHDRWANSIVIRSRSSGIGRTAFGCIVYIVLTTAIFAVLFGIMIVTVGPLFVPLIEDLRLQMPSTPA